MLHRLNDFLLGINQNRPAISRRLNVLLLGVLQAFGGMILYNTDYATGVPLVIQASGIIAMPTFAVLMSIAGIITLLFGVFAPGKINATRLVLLTIPYIAYIAFAISGAFGGAMSLQPAFLYFVTYLIVIVGVWGID